MLKRDVHYEITKFGEMEFVYAAFFEDREDVFIKFGRSVKPYGRIRDVAMGSPFPISRAVFAQAGSKRLAGHIERCMYHRLREYRTRGEWYRLGRDQGKVFSQVAQIIFARATGRMLIWTPVDTAAMRSELLAASEKYFAHRHKAKGLAEQKRAA
jgi:hypothetical protein